MIILAIIVSLLVAYIIYQVWKEVNTAETLEKIEFDPQQTPSARLEVVNRFHRSLPREAIITQSHVRIFGRYRPYIHPDLNALEQADHILFQYQEPRV